MKKIVFLVSGNGGNLKFFHQAPKVLGKQLFDLCVIADRDCLALEYGRANNLDSHLVKYKRTQNLELKEFLSVASGGPRKLVKPISDESV